MKFVRKVIHPIFLAAVWISFSEFLRNELLFKGYWINHYSSLGIIFPSETINGAIWGVWSIVFSIIIYFISNKYNLFQTTFISWIAGFVLMWLVLGNLSVLPFSLLFFAIPLSIFETFIAALIIRKISK